jgi:hypothetical protein
MSRAFHVSVPIDVTDLTDGLDFEFANEEMARKFEVMNNGEKDFALVDVSDKPWRF